MTRINQHRISVRTGPKIAPRPAPAPAPAPAPERRGPKIAPRPAPVPANMNKIGGTRRKHRRRKYHRLHTKKLKKRTM